VNYCGLETLPVKGKKIFLSRNPGTRARIPINLELASSNP
jgi:hypothetical protein